MAKLTVARGTTHKLIRVFVQDASQSDGSGLASLTASSPGLTFSYSRQGDLGATAVPLVAGTVGTWSSGGLAAVDSIAFPGVYELGLPDAMLASGDSVVGLLRGAASMVTVALEIELAGLNLQDSVRGGLTALPNTAAGGAGGVPTGLASGRVTVGAYGPSQDPVSLQRAAAITPPADLVAGTWDAAITYGYVRDVGYRIEILSSDTLEFFMPDGTDSAFRLVFAPSIAQPLTVTPLFPPYS